MKKIPIPEIAFITAYHACVSGISDIPLSSKFLSNANIIEQKCANYNVTATRGLLYTLPQTIHSRGQNPIVAGTSLSKSELSSLYSSYMVPKTKPARKLIYDQLIVTANERCPFCGGIGRVRSLDHYLPKANFPEFSVFPANLVPACKECNEDKSNTVAQNIGDQVLHPYFDQPHFFEVQWVHGEICEGDVVICNYHASAPEDWSLTDQQRVVRHFQDYKLAERYRLQAAEEISSIINLRSRSLSKLSHEDFRDYLRDSANDENLFINHWRRVLYRALSDSEWFCSENFT